MIPSKPTSQNLQRPHILLKSCTILSVLLSMASKTAKYCAIWTKDTTTITLIADTRIRKKRIGQVSWPNLDHYQANVLSINSKIFDRPEKFIIDRGAEVSLISKSLVPHSLLHPCDICITGVNGWKIQTFGQVNTSRGSP